MIVAFYPTAWDEYQEWMETDRKLLKRLNGLIRECQRHPFEGTGKPEALRENFSGWWSRRIDREHRLVYRVVGGDGNQTLEIAQCRLHY